MLQRVTGVLEPGGERDLAMLRGAGLADPLCVVPGSERRYGTSDASDTRWFCGDTGKRLQIYSIFMLGHLSLFSM